MGAKILVLDIENAPNLGYFWETWSRGSWTAIKVVEEWYILCVGYMWFGEKAQCVALPDFTGYKTNPRNEKRLLRVVWKLLDEADIVIGWNSKAFDIKKLNAKFLSYGFVPPSPYKQIDVMQEKKKLARSNSNRLDNTSEEWGTGHKLKNEGFPLWESCMAGDMKAWKKMVRYCIRDVIITEKNYRHLRPWMATHPNLAIYSGLEGTCPVCQKAGTLVRNGTYNTPTRKRQQYQCSTKRGGCGRFSTGALLPARYDQNRLVR